jgi:hypothetical protein
MHLSSNENVILVEFDSVEVQTFVIEVRSIQKSRNEDINILGIKITHWVVGCIA